MRILFLRLGGIGDVVQCAMAIAIFKKENSHCNVDWAVSDSLVPFVQALGVADRVVSINYGGLVEGSFFSRLKTFFQEAFKLKRLGAYQKIANAHADYRYKLLTGLVKVKQKNQLDRPFPIVHRYRVYEYYRLLTNQDPVDCDINSGINVIRENLRIASAGIQQKLPCNYVLLAPGGAKNLLSDNPQRRWPIGHYVELAKKIRTIGLQVVIAGAPSDSWVSESFIDSGAIDLVGKTDLINLFSLMDHSRGVVTHDSGPLHIAMVAGAPLFAIFGPTPANAFVSFARPNTSVLHKQNLVTCSPCYDGKRYAPCTDNQCMSEVNADLVFDEFSAKLGRFSFKLNQDLRNEI